MTHAELIARYNTSYTATLREIAQLRNADKPDVALIAATQETARAIYKAWQKAKGL